jgi:thiol:disulfide interchange protein
MARTEIASAANQRTIPRWLPWVVVALVALRVASLYLPKENPRDLVRWVSVSEAQMQSAASGKPIMYEFSAAWCGPCRAMEREVFDNREMAEQINAAVVPVRIVDRQREDGRNRPEIAALQRRYGIRLFPTIVLAGTSGNESARLEGFGSRPAFQAILNGARSPAPLRGR